LRGENVDGRERNQGGDQEIKKLEPTQKLEIFKWVNSQINFAEFVLGVGVYRSLDIPLKGDHKLKVIN
jgi:hypothetical protein